MRKKHKIDDVITVTTPRGKGKFRVVHEFDPEASIWLNLDGNFVGLQRLTLEKKSSRYRGLKRSRKSRL